MSNKLDNQSYSQSIVILNVYIENERIYMEYEEPFPEVIDIPELYIKVKAYNNSSANSPELKVQFDLRNPPFDIYGGLNPIIIPPIKPGDNDEGKTMSSIVKNHLNTIPEYILTTKLTDSADNMIQTLVNYINFSDENKSELFIKGAELKQSSREIEIIVDILNTGNDIATTPIDIASPFFYTAIYYSTDLHLNTKKDLQISSKRTNQLLQGESETQIHRVTIPLGNNSVSGYIIIKVDDLNNISERDENNNLFIIPIDSKSSRSNVSKLNTSAVFVSAFPNPVNEHITFSFERKLNNSKAELYIYDAVGTLIHTQQTTTRIFGEKTHFRYENLGLQKGVYSYILHIEKEKHTGMIIKK